MVTLRKPWYAAAAILAAAVLIAGLAGAGPGRAATARPGTRIVHTHTGHVNAGKLVRATTRKTPFAPTKAQKNARDAAMKKLASLPRAPIGPHTTKASVQQLKGPQTALTTRQAPTDFKIFQDSAVPSQCAGCAQSAINEPDTANAGRFIMQTSNWNIAYTTDGGGSSPQWQYQDPYSLDGSFCCDQTVISIPSRNRFVYEGLSLGTGSQTGFDIATTATWTPTSWCVYHFDGSAFGGTAGDVLDYPKIAYSNNYVYVTWNEYDPTGSTWLYTGLARLPIDAMSSCSSISYNYLTRTDNFTFGLTYGASSLDQFYWVSNWYTQAAGSGTSERIFSWPENSTSYSYTDVGVASYNFSGGSCASQDGVVTDWCSRLDPRWETAWISRAEYNAQANSAFAGDATLGVSITAGPGGGDPFPYVIYEYFKLNSLGYIQTSATYNDGFAIAYGACSPDVYGYVGCVASWGGGTGTTHYYPGGLILIQDNVSPTQPWAYSFNLSGAGNATAWGDYMVSQPYEPEVGPWITTEWIVKSNGTVVPHEVVWGRLRDSNGWYRWKKT